jgi:hypothetical protein
MRSFIANASQPHGPLALLASATIMRRLQLTFAER